MNINSIVIRYVSLLVIGAIGFLSATGLFHAIASPLTVYPVYWALNSVYGASLLPPDTLFFQGYYLNIVAACVAASAYYLLLILTFTTPMTRVQYFRSVLFTFITFWFLNVCRIIYFSTLLLKGYQYFDIAHVTTWYFGSTVLVVFIWLVNLKLNKISGIPIYDDIRMLVKEITKSR